MMQLLYNVIYNPSVNRVLRWLNKNLPTGSFRLHPVGTIRISTDSVSFLLNTNQTSHISKLLYYEGADVYEFTPAFVCLVKRCRTFLDVGANIGYYSLLGATVNKELAVFSFEPAPGPLQYLRSNIALNRKDHQIQVQSLALDQRRGSFSFYAAVNPKYPTTPDIGGTGSLQMRHDSQSVVTVDTVTLDEWMNEHALGGVDLIKLDTEGAEDRILSGASQTIDRFKPVIVCETLFNGIESQLETIMQSHGYEFYHVQADRLHLTRIETLRRESDDGARECFMVHPSRRNLLIESGLLD